MKDMTIEEKLAVQNKEGYEEMYNDDGILYMYKKHADQFSIYKFSENEQKETSMSLFFDEIELLYNEMKQATK
jgi:hypothetical protein